MIRDFSKAKILKPTIRKVKKNRRVRTILSSSQEEAVTAVDYWYRNNLSYFFSLTGAAGTGKTFVIRYIIENILKGKKVCVSAPTHKAVKVIEDFTGLKGATIHSIHGLRPNFNFKDFNIDKIKFESTGKNKFNKYDVIIIDEASMISKGMHKLNKTRATQYNTRIIYLGDLLQLLPVGEATVSAAFDSKYKYNLTEIIRQKEGNPIINLLSKLRDDVIGDSAVFINYIRKFREEYNDDKGYIVLNKHQFTEQVALAFTSDLFKTNINVYRIGAFTNDQVQRWNNYIRKLLITSTDLICIGDKLMGYKTIVDEYLSPIIINSNDYLVESCNRKLTDDGFYVYDLFIRDYNTGFTTNIYIVDHKDTDAFKKYYGKLCELHHAALYGDPIQKGKLWKAYYHYKETFITMIDFTLSYGNHRQAFVKREIDYAYAVTIHKLQGSTINNIFLDTMDICYYDSNPIKPRINTYKDKTVINNRNRLLYTGLSRASEKAIILNY